MTDAARAVLARADEFAGREADGRTIEEIRAEVRAGCAPFSEAAIRDSGVSVEDSCRGGVPVTVVTPPGAQAGRTILYLFGGGFMMGSPFEDMPIITALATGAQASVVAPHYRLAPEHPFPAALDDIDVVAATLEAEGMPYVLSGESAGANLSLALTHRLRRLGRAVPKALALMSPATDMGFGGDSHEADRDPFLRAARTAEVRDAYLGGRDHRDPEISPIYGSFDAGFPATLVTTGSRDLLLSDCLRLARIMREAGARCDLRVWDGMWHVFEYYPDVPEAALSLAEIAAFIDVQFG